GRTRRSGTNINECVHWLINPVPQTPSWWVILGCIPGIVLIQEAKIAANHIGWPKLGHPTQSFFSRKHGIRDCSAREVLRHIVVALQCHANGMQVVLTFNPVRRVPYPVDAGNAEAGNYQDQQQDNSHVNALHTSHNNEGGSPAKQRLRHCSDQSCSGVVFWRETTVWKERISQETAKGPDIRHSVSLWQLTQQIDHFDCGKRGFEAFVS